MLERLQGRSGFSVSKSEKGINGYDTANYNRVVGESLDAVWCPFVFCNSSTTLKKRAWCAFFFVQKNIQTHQS
jgi:hypothetical protein